MNNKIIKYLATTSLLTILTGILGFLALNRLWATCNEGKLFIDFIFRNSLEHLLTGFYAPLITTFFLLLATYFISKRNIYNESLVITFLIIGSILYLLSQFYFQFSMSPNSGSVIQIIMDFIGIIFCWVYYLLYWGSYD